MSQTFVRDKVSEVELDMSETWSETWSETRKYSSGLVRSGPVRSGRSSGIWPLRCVNRKFRAFWAYDLDLDPMTFIY